MFAGWKVAIGLGLALAGTGWLLYDAIEDKGQLREAVKSKQAEVDRLVAVAKVAEIERKKDREIFEAGDRTVNHVMVEREVRRTVFQPVIREVHRAEDANAPCGAAMRAAFDRLRNIDARDRDRHKDGNSGAARLAAAGAGPPGGAPSCGRAAEYVILLYEHARGLEDQLRAIEAWVGEARKIREGRP